MLNIPIFPLSAPGSTQVVATPSNLAGMEAVLPDTRLHVIVNDCHRLEIKVPDTRPQVILEDE